MGKTYLLQRLKPDNNFPVEKLTDKDSSLKIKFFDFARKLMQKISTDIDNNIQTPQSEIYSLMKILKNIPQVKQYEISKTKSKSQKCAGQLTSEIIDQIESKVLGF